MLLLKEILKKKAAGKDLTVEEEAYLEKHELEKQAVNTIRTKKAKGIPLTMWEKSVLSKFAGLGKTKTKKDDKREGNGPGFALDLVDTDDWKESNAAVVLTLTRFFELVRKGQTLRYASLGAGLVHNTVNRWLRQGEEDAEKELDTRFSWFYLTTKAKESEAMEHHIDVINGDLSAKNSIAWLKNRWAKEFGEETTIKVETEQPIDKEHLDEVLKDYLNDKDDS